MKRFGFTGTREKMTPRQKAWLVEWLGVHTRPNDELHHGDCVGADEFVHYVALALGLRVKVHPPEDKRHQAFCSGFDDRAQVFPPLPYHRRNENIVSHTDELIAVPRRQFEEMRSGTWSTVRKARRFNKPITIIGPGKVLSDAENQESTRASA